MILRSDYRQDHSAYAHPSDQEIELSDSQMKHRPLPELPKSEEEFLRLMDWVDAVLSSEGVSIHARPIRALGEVAAHYGISMRGGPLPTEPRPGSYSGEDLSLRMSRWFERRYGERLLVDFSVGRSVVVLRGAVWLMGIPRVYGRAEIVCDPRMVKPEVSISLGGEEVPPLNVLDYMDRMTDDFKLALTPNERGWLMLRWLECFNAYYALDDLRGLKLSLIGNSLYDLDASVDYLMSPRRPFGLAKWSALQAAEKVLKAFIAYRRATFERTHDLSQLRDDAISKGLPDFPEDWLSAVQCDAAVRYGEIPVERHDAVNSHYASLKIAEHVALEIARLSDSIASRGRRRIEIPSPPELAASTRITSTL